jgi:hypothetical protein
MAGLNYLCSWLELPMLGCQGERALSVRRVTNDRIVASNLPTAAVPAAVTFFSLPALAGSVRLLDGPAPGMPTVDVLLLSPTGDTFAATVRDNATPRLILWSADGAVVASVQVPETNRMAFSPDGRHVLLGSRLLERPPGCQSGMPSTRSSSTIP